MFGKINVWSIIRDHVGTLRSADSKSLSKADLLGSFIFPLAPAIILPAKNIYLPADSVGSLLTAVSVFGALLFNLLILVYDVSGRDPKISVDQMKIRRRLLGEIHDNVAFAVLTTIVMIVFFIPSAISTNEWMLRTTSVAFYYLLPLFILTLLMVLKRMSRLLSRDIEMGPE